MPGRGPRIWELSPEDVLGMSCHDAFAAIDKDGSGSLSFDELKAVLVRKDGGGELTEAAFAGNSVNATLALECAKRTLLAARAASCSISSSSWPRVDQSTP